MGFGFAPTWLRQVSPLLHKTTLTTDVESMREMPLLLVNCEHELTHAVTLYVSQLGTITAH